MFDCLFLTVFKSNIDWNVIKDGVEITNTGKDQLENEDQLCSTRDYLSRFAYTVSSLEDQFQIGITVSGKFHLTYTKTDRL